MDPSLLNSDNNFTISHNRIPQFPPSNPDTAADAAKTPTTNSAGGARAAQQHEQRPIDAQQASTESDSEDVDRLSPVAANDAEPLAAAPFDATSAQPLGASVGGRNGHSNGSSSTGADPTQAVSSAQPLDVPSSSRGASGNGTGNSSSGGEDHPPEDPEYDAQVVEQMLQKASPALTDSRFSMADFLKNKAAMTAAARKELAGGADHTLHRPAAEGADDIASSLEDAGHAADLARQASHLESVVQAVAEEGKVNRELAGLLLEGLEASKRAVECLMRLLITLSEAEAAYSTAMSAAAKTASAGPLTAPSDSSNLLAALEGMVALPAAAAAGHRQLYLELQVLSDAAKSLWRRYSAKAKELKQSVHTVQRGIDGCCKQLMTTLNDHKAACHAFDASVVWQQAPGHNSSSSGAGSANEQRPRFRTAPGVDPWTTEGKLLAEQQALKRWQDQERELLQQGYETLQVLEAERIADLLKAGQALSASYPAAVQSLPPAAEELRGRLAGLGGAGEAGLQSLAKVAADMRATSETLALRQSDSLAVLSQELFCSPDIIRQGTMDLWNARSSVWGCCHFVLTRAGFLHWFKDIDSTTPLEPPLNLSRCEFEQGAAPAFNLVESGAGSWLMGRSGRKVTLKASSVEECCEWAIALREAIALSSSAGGSGGLSRTTSNVTRH